MRGAFLLLVLPTLAAAVHSFYAKKVGAFDDKKISQSVMWSLINVTKFRCVAECLKEKHCVSFHFSPSELVCVALRRRFEGSSVASVEAFGYQLFQTNRPLAKIGSACEQDVDCASLLDSHCNQGTCRCDVGYGIYGDVCRILTGTTTVGERFASNSATEQRKRRVKTVPENRKRHIKGTTTVGERFASNSATEQRKRRVKIVPENRKRHIKGTTTVGERFASNSATEQRKRRVKTVPKSRKRHIKGTTAVGERFASNSATEQRKRRVKTVPESRKRHIKGTTTVGERFASHSAWEQRKRRVKTVPKTRKRHIKEPAWVGSACKLNVDCMSLPNSHCNQGACKCNVGYGIDGHVCRILTECSNFSTQFTLYNSSVIIGYDLLAQGRSSYESCHALCINESRCQSADLDFFLKICYLNSITWLDSTLASRVTNSATFHFFQRECLWRRS